MRLVAYYRSILSSDERQRAERFRFENLRRSYTLSRGGLRILLAHYLGCAPTEIELICWTEGQTGPSRLLPDPIQHFAFRSNGTLCVHPWV